MLRRFGLAGLLTACATVPPPPKESPIRGTEVLTWSAPTGRVFGVRAGDSEGRRVILVHGTPGSHAEWKRYLLSPSPGVELIALDRPGFGSSEPACAVPSLAAQAAAIEPLLVERNGHYPLLVGHSLGGPVIARVAADYPERVGGLLVLAGNLDPHLEKLHWYNDLAALVSPLLSRSLRNSNDELGPQRTELEALAPLLSRITCPVWIVHGSEDSLVPFANAEYLEKSLVNAATVERVNLPGEDHFFIWTRPEVVRAVLERALAYQAPPRPHAGSAASAAH